MANENNGAAVLAAGGIAAILASACCLGPLVLVSLGLGGAWIGNLTAPEPLRPVFVGAALAALFFAYRRIFRPAAECKSGAVCARPAISVSVSAAVGVPISSDLLASVGAQLARVSRLHVAGHHGAVSRSRRMRPISRTQAGDRGHKGGMRTS